jgi:hypothetical protein
MHGRFNRFQSFVSLELRVASDGLNAIRRETASRLDRSRCASRSALPGRVFGALKRGIAFVIRRSASSPSPLSRQPLGAILGEL